MEDKINELKKLISTLEDNSPLRKQLEEALAAELQRKLDELKRKVEAASQTNAEEKLKNEQPLPKPPKTDASSPDNETQPPQTDGSCNNAEGDSGKSGKRTSSLFDGLDTIADKLGSLLEDEEFITASAGFVLGAAAVGLCVLGLNVLKK